MLRSLPLLLLLALGTMAGAQTAWPEPETGPAPLPFPGRERWAPDEDDNPAHTPLAEFRAKMKQLREERDLLQSDRKKTERLLEGDAGGEGELLKLRYRLSGLLTRMADKSALPPPPPLPKISGLGETSVRPAAAEADAPPKKDEKKKDDRKKDESKTRDALRLGHVPDPFALGTALFRAGNYRDALVAFRMIPLSTLKPGERAPIQYLMASCLSKEGKYDEATPLFREVANTPGDERLAACAQWQIATLRWHKEMRTQLQQVRERRKALEKAP
ncbi:MAG: hypothetical protein U0793_17875 [Gemmataceae bacterium]